MRPAESYSDHEYASWDSHHHCDLAYLDADHREDAASSGASTPRGDLLPARGVFSGGSHKDSSPGKPSRDSGDESEGKPAISRILSSKAESWIGRKGLGWPWKGNEHDATDPKSSRFFWPWIHNDPEHELGQQHGGAATFKSENQVENQVNGTNRTSNNETSGYWSSSVNVNSSSSASSCSSTSSSVINKADTDIDSLDYVILWEDLTIGDQIGQG